VAKVIGIGVIIATSLVFPGVRLLFPLWVILTVFAVLGTVSGLIVLYCIEEGFTETWQKILVKVITVIVVILLVASIGLTMFDPISGERRPFNVGSFIIVICSIYICVVKIKMIFTAKDVMDSMVADKGLLLRSVTYDGNVPFGQYTYEYEDKRLENKAAAKEKFDDVTKK
jgi:hypothetical protein